MGNNPDTVSGAKYEMQCYVEAYVRLRAGGDHGVAAREFGIAEEVNR